MGIWEKIRRAMALKEKEYRIRLEVKSFKANGVLTFQTIKKAYTKNHAIELAKEELENSLNTTILKSVKVKDAN